MSFVIYVFMLFVSFVSVGGVSLFFLVCFAVSSMSLVSLFANIITHPHNPKKFLRLCGCRWGVVGWCYYIFANPNNKSTPKYLKKTRTIKKLLGGLCHICRLCHIDVLLLWCL